MEVGHRFKAYWCVRDFDSPIWWQLQVCDFFPLRVSKDIQYSLRATLDRGAQQSLSECHRTKNRGDFSLSSLYITATEAHQKRDYLLENGFPKESRGKWNLMLDKWINIYDTFSGNMKALSITAHYAKQKKEKKQQQR